MVNDTFGWSMGPWESMPARRRQRKGGGWWGQAVAERRQGARVGTRAREWLARPYRGLHGKCMNFRPGGRISGIFRATVANFRNFCLRARASGARSLSPRSTRSDAPMRHFCSIWRQVCATHNHLALAGLFAARAIRPPDSTAKVPDSTTKSTVFERKPAHGCVTCVASLDFRQFQRLVTSRGVV
jgi:hypothetical protein